VLLVPLALAAGCSVTPDYDKVEIIERYRVSQNALPECVAAAKRASYWCGRRIPVTDQFYSDRCLSAEREYWRACN
jgi:hypothetical protein